MMKRLVLTLAVVPVALVMGLAVFAPITDGPFHHRVVGALYEVGGGPEPLYRILLDLEQGR
jgi:hypothetical protein